MGFASLCIRRGIVSHQRSSCGRLFFSEFVVVDVVDDDGDDEEMIRCLIVVSGCQTLHRDFWANT